MIFTISVHLCYLHTNPHCEVEMLLRCYMFKLLPWLQNDINGTYAWNVGNILQPVLRHISTTEPALPSTYFKLSFFYRTMKIDTDSQTNHLTSLNHGYVIRLSSPMTKYSMHPSLFHPDLLILVLEVLITTLNIQECLVYHSCLIHSVHNDP